MCQLVVTVLMLVDTVRKPKEIKDLSEFPSDWPLVVARIICALQLHLSLNQKIKSLLDLTKFFCNHSKMFDKWALLFFACLLKGLLLWLVQIVNILLIICAHDVRTVVLNFMVMNAIAEFDSYYFKLMKTPDNYTKFILEESEDFIKKLFIIKKTTSKIAKKQLENPEVMIKDNNLKPKSIKIYKKKKITDDREGYHGYSVELRENFTYITAANIELKDLVIYWKDRDFSNKCLFFVYRAVKVIYVTIWCYLAPFLTLMASYAVPYLLN